MATQLRKSSRRKNSSNDQETSIPTKKAKTKAMIPNRINLHKTSYNLAQNLLGKLLVRKIGKIICKGRIVETECYPGGKDKASCTFNGKKTPASEPLYMEAGT
ncbi:hypothetical protein AMK59_5858, partial [Oryctes borbonicus]